MIFSNKAHALETKTMEIDINQEPDLNQFGNWTQTVTDLPGVPDLYTDQHSITKAHPITCQQLIKYKMSQKPYQTQHQSKDITQLSVLVNQDCLMEQQLLQKLSSNQDSNQFLQVNIVNDTIEQQNLVDFDCSKHQYLQPLRLSLSQQICRLKNNSLKSQDCLKIQQLVTKLDKIVQQIEEMMKHQNKMQINRQTKRYFTINKVLDVVLNKTQLNTCHQSDNHFITDHDEDFKDLAVEASERPFLRTLSTTKFIQITLRKNFNQQSKIKTQRSMSRLSTKSPKSKGIELVQSKKQNKIYSASKQNIFSSIKHKNSTINFQPKYLKPNPAIFYSKNRITKHIL